MPRKNNGKRRSRYSELERFAYKMGQVGRGVSNPNSKIAESYAKGEMKPKQKNRKTLFGD